MDKVRRKIATLAMENQSILEVLYEGKFGLEKEGLRVDEQGGISREKHPVSLGEKFTNPFMSTDFAEAQPELITPPLESIHSMMGYVETLQSILQQAIGDELIWPNSLAPEGDLSEVAVADFGEEGHEKTLYRQYLLEKYGMERMLMSGIHFNYSLSESLLLRLTKEESNAFYLKMMRNFLRYRWVLIWLFGTSPYAKRQKPQDPSSPQEASPCEDSASYRNTDQGYRNSDDFYLPFDTLEAYHQSIADFIADGKLESASELYAPMRLKFNADGDINHLEVRLLDLYPFHPSHVNRDVIYFTHQFLIYCLLKEESQEILTLQEHLICNANSDLASCKGREEVELLDWDEQRVPLVQLLRVLLTEMGEMLEGLPKPVDEGYRVAFSKALEYMDNPGKRPVVKLKMAIEKEGFQDLHLRLAREHKEKILSTAYRFHSLEDLELSTQLLLQAALAKGVPFELLDRAENAVRLSLGAHQEYVVQATKTGLDNYSAILKMENKVVTKYLLHEQGICVPQGKSFSDEERACGYFSELVGRSCVVKPKSTNFGLGVSILKENDSQAIFTEAVGMAFKHDDTILIEEFISGKEYRFFVIDDEVCGVLHRVPANVVGDGKSSIAELVAIKNTDPLRGKGYRTPLEKIVLGDAEALFLRMQGLHFSSVPARGQQVYLRENSNISTGGDSIDVSDDVDTSYAEIAIRAAACLGVRITGVDMMIDDITRAAGKDNYAVIEMNFNPAIHIHCFPHEGKRRNIHEKLINVLFPEL